MDNSFNKYEFIKANNEFLYGRLEDFLRTEVNKETFPIIYNFLSLQNFRSGEFEGNLKSYVMIFLRLDLV